MTDEDRNRSSVIPPASRSYSYLFREPFGISTTHLIVMQRDYPLRCRFSVGAVEVLRQLPQNRTQPSGLDQRLETLVEDLDPLADARQSSDMGQVSAGLDREPESIRRLARPPGGRIAGRQPVEGGVHLNGVELGRVELKPSPTGLALGIKPAAPVVVVPPRAADPRTLHRRFDTRANPRFIRSGDTRTWMAGFLLVGVVVRLCAGYTPARDASPSRLSASRPREVNA